MGSRPPKRMKSISVSSQGPGEAVACCWHIPGLFHTNPFPVSHEGQAQQSQSGHDGAITPRAITHTKTDFPLGCSGTSRYQNTAKNAALCWSSLEMQDSCQSSLKPAKVLSFGPTIDCPKDFKTNNSQHRHNACNWSFLRHPPSYLIKPFKSLCILFIGAVKNPRTQYKDSFILFYIAL